MFVIYCPSRKKRFRAHDLAAVFVGAGGNCKFWEEIPHPKMPAINTETNTFCNKDSCVIFTCRNSYMVYALKIPAISHLNQILVAI